MASMSVPDDRPIRFTDSPQHYLPSTMSTTSGLGSIYTTNTSSIGQPPTPSPRRKTSASSFSEVPELHYDQSNRTPIYIPGNYVEYRPSQVVEDVVQNHTGYFGNSESYVSNGTSSNTVLAILTGSNYFPYRPEVNFAFERDYRSYPEYTYEGTNHNKYVYDSPRVPRMPSKIPMGVNASNHRRTLSNISSTSSNINSGFRLESDDVPDTYQFNNLNSNNSNHATPNKMRVYENIPFATQFQHQSNTKHPPIELTSSVQERPMTLSFEPGHQAKFRSSLKKHTVSRTTSAAGTPTTNPTPPDSLTSDDSSYLSARDSSISSQSRVRFSPETLLDVPIQGQSQDPTIPLQAAKRMSRRMTHSSGGETSS